MRFPADDPCAAHISTIAAGEAFLELGSIFSGGGYLRGCVSEIQKQIDVCFVECVIYIYIYIYSLGFAETWRPWF